MSLGSALSIATSGLTATSRAADLTSQNIANGLTEGYARREVSLTTRNTGGVAVTGVTRFADQALIADRRVAEAGSAASRVVADYHSDMEDAVGVDGAIGSLGSLVSVLGTALIGAASHPQSDSALTTVVTAASTLANRVNELAGDVQKARLTADNEIASGVDAINIALKHVETLNAQIASLPPTGDETATLQDQRQALVDKIAAQVPLREIVREDGRIALMTTGGASLLDGKAAKLGFSGVNTMTAEMTAQSGALSGLTLNGNPLPLSALGDGALSAQFTLRDTIAPQTQAQLGRFSADLTTRFAGTGLFDAGPGGLTIDASLTAEPWRLRDGLAAAAEGDTGNATRLNAMVTSLSSGTGASGAAGALLSAVSSARLAAEDEASFNTARYDTLRTAELSSSGVNTDTEMASLLVIQQAYTANAKVITIVDEMMQTILGI